MNGSARQPESDAPVVLVRFQQQQATRVVFQRAQTRWTAQDDPHKGQRELPRHMS
jgi:hypothetical protein